MAKGSDWESADVEDDNGGADDCDGDDPNKWAYEFNLMSGSSTLLCSR